MRDLLARLSSGNTLLYTGAALGVLTALLTLLVLAGSDDETAAPQAPQPSAVERLEQETDTVVVARDLIPAGVALEEALLKEDDVLKDSAPEGAFAQIEDVVGRVSRFPMVRGEQVLESNLVGAEAGTREGLAFSVPPGTRAVSVAFSDVMGAGGLVVPGDRVDVLISTRAGSMFGPGETLPEDEDPDHPTVFTLMQNVLVLAVGRTFTDPLESGQDPATLRVQEPQVAGARTITLSVSPEQAQVLFFAAERGKLGLALRPFGDSSGNVLTPEYKLTPTGIVPVAGSGVSR